MYADFSFTVNVTPVSCFDANDGSIIVHASGGSGNFSYSKGDGFQSSNEFLNLAAGTYPITVLDNESGCKKSQFVTVTQPTQIEYMIHIDDPLCFGEQGVINVGIEGGIPPYTISLDGHVVATDVQPTPPAPLTKISQQILARMRS